MLVCNVYQSSKTTPTWFMLGTSICTSSKHPYQICTTTQNFNSGNLILSGDAFICYEQQKKIQKIIQINKSSELSHHR